MLSPPPPPAATAAAAVPSTISAKPVINEEFLAQKARMDRKRKRQEKVIEGTYHSPPQNVYVSLINHAFAEV